MKASMANLTPKSLSKPFSLHPPHLKKQPANTAFPTYLITGLLGSGKTTSLLKLLEQKPEKETWAILVNEFGDISLDDKVLESANVQNVIIKTVQGGCICCTAGHQLSQAIQSLITEQPHLDKLWIEPTGLGHPAGIIDTLSHTPKIHLKNTLATLTAKQLTPERWKKSTVMRDIATLSDVILLTQTDLATTDEIQQSLDIINNLYPKKTEIWQSYDDLKLQTLANLPPIAFKIRESTHMSQPLQTIKATLSNQCIQSLSLQFDAQLQQIHAIGVTFNAQQQFNRVLLKEFFEQNSATLIRTKGLLRTGKNWQLVQWQGSQLSLSDFAWRQDSRIELLLNPDSNESFQFSQTQALENTEYSKISEQDLPAGIISLLNSLLACIHHK